MSGLKLAPAVGGVAPVKDTVTIETVWSNHKVTTRVFDVAAGSMEVDFYEVEDALEATDVDLSFTGVERK